MIKAPEPTWRVVRAFRLWVNCRVSYGRPETERDSYTKEIMAGNTGEVLDDEEGDWQLCRLWNGDLVWIERTFLL